MTEQRYPTSFYLYFSYPRLIIILFFLCKTEYYNQGPYLFRVSEVKHVCPFSDLTLCQHWQLPQFKSVGLLPSMSLRPEIGIHWTSRNLPTFTVGVRNFDGTDAKKKKKNECAPVFKETVDITRVIITNTKENKSANEIRRGRCNPVNTRNFDMVYTRCINWPNHDWHRCFTAFTTMLTDIHKYYRHDIES